MDFCARAIYFEFYLETEIDIQIETMLKACRHIPAVVKLSMIQFKHNEKKMNRMKNTTGKL